VVKIYLFCYYSPIICLAPPKKRVPTPPFGREMAEVGWINAVQSVSYNHTAASTLPRHRWSPNYSLIVPSGRQKWYHRDVIYGITLHFASQQLGKKSFRQNFTLAHAPLTKILDTKQVQITSLWAVFSPFSQYRPESQLNGQLFREYIPFEEILLKIFFLNPIFFWWGGSGFFSRY
jgi:hypothetical protein